MDKKTILLAFLALFSALLYIDYLVFSGNIKFLKNVLLATLAVFLVLLLFALAWQRPKKPAGYGWEKIFKYAPERKSPFPKKILLIVIALLAAVFLLVIFSNFILPDFSMNITRPLIEVPRIEAPANNESLSGFSSPVPGIRPYFPYILAGVLILAVLIFLILHFEKK